MNIDIKDVRGNENPNFTIGEEPPERCVPRYEDRVFINVGEIIVRCVKIGVPDIEFFNQTCEELNLTNENYIDKCVIE